MLSIEACARVRVSLSSTTMPSETKLNAIRIFICLTFSTVGNLSDEVALPVCVCACVRACVGVCVCVSVCACACERINRHLLHGGFFVVELNLWWLIPFLGSPLKKINPPHPLPPSRLPSASHWSTISLLFKRLSNIQKEKKLSDDWCLEPKLGAIVAPSPVSCSGARIFYSLRHVIISV